MIPLLEKLGVFLLENADLLDDVIEVINSGTPKEALRAAIRAVKVKVSDEAMKEELGL